VERKACDARFVHYARTLSPEHPPIFADPREHSSFDLSGIDILRWENEGGARRRRDARTDLLRRQAAETKETPMRSGWALVGLGMLAAITTVFWWSMTRVRRDELGFVSQRWLIEHRQSQSHDERS
jgi:hypothetical protein